ncbi:MAG: hypothetical protein OEY50_07740 [Nitrospinota bacterium]|nr:hypothetical protein [Nitrospinota bacterium]
MTDEKSGADKNAPASGSAPASGGADRPYVTFLRDREIPYLYDVELNRMDELKSYDSVELHVVLYPYSKIIDTSNYVVNPFEEYARDISGHLRSSYVPIHNPMANIFGLALGGLIAAIFSLVAPDELFSVEAVVSILGAYAIGKELYGDIDNGLVRLTKNWKARFLGQYYAYRMERGATLTSYSALARQRRYGKQTLMPELFDFMEKSNSVTVRLLFTDEDLARFYGGSSAHILSVSMDENLNDEFKNGGFMLGIKIAFNTRMYGLTHSRELFQSIDGQLKGCLVKGTEWKNGAVGERITYSLRRIKYFASSKVVENLSIVESCL